MNLFRHRSGMPAGPFFHAVAREDQIPIAPMSDSAEGLDEVAAMRAAIGAPTLVPGDHVGPIQHLRDQPTDLSGYPVRIYELEGVAGLRREGLSKRLQYLVADDALVARELPAWWYFGPHGEGVPEVLDAIWTLDPERVSRLVVPPGDHPFEQIPIPLLAYPKDDRGAYNAAGAAMNWTENRSWAAGQQGGGFLYRGCYFTYVVTDPRWLMAMGLAYNAAVALALGPNIAPDERTTVLAAWAGLTRG
jgi:hypothetical protein